MDLHDDVVVDFVTNMDKDIHTIVDVDMIMNSLVADVVVYLHVATIVDLGLHVIVDVDVIMHDVVEMVFMYIDVMDDCDDKVER